MSALQRIAATALALLLILIGYGLWATRAPLTAPRTLSAPGTPAGVPVIDEDTLFTAQHLSRLATTRDELTLSQQAIELADHELDLAFSGVLRHLEANPPQLSAAARAIQEKLTHSQAQLSADTTKVKRLTQAMAAAADAEKPALQDQLDLAQAQADIDTYEVGQANDSLLQAGGNVHQRIQAMQHAIEVADQNRPPAALAPDPLASAQGLVGRVRQWLALRGKQQAIERALGQAAASVDELSKGREQIAAEIAADKSGLEGTASPPASRLEAARRTAAQQQRLSVRDQRIGVRKRLVETYGQWIQLVQSQARAAMNQALIDTAVIVVALLLVVFFESGINGLLGRTHIDRRQLGALRSVVSVILQLVAVLAILLILIGVPGQLGTILGLAGAGLTVALKDFIVAFIGWFVLMGRNGVRLGDWVEINGVSGEVIELGMFHTVLLETGNWTDAGHPTGRRVTFTNSFAIEGHYFNFSTTGQWLWDEVSVVVPFGRDSQAIATAIEKEAVAATANSGTEAEEEWRRATHGQRGVSVSAQPGIAVRPTSGGVEVMVRYVTRASERMAVRARLYQSAVQLLAQSGSKPA
ncbi:MAG TPA: mechanosensitive ion channel domain-containing protein [Steroidobacteraceae bacterium]|jgi:small-conductance mechanosensitive channel